MFFFHTLAPGSDAANPIDLDVLLKQVEHRARDDALLTVCELACRQLVGGGADTRPHDAGA